MNMSEQEATIEGDGKGKYCKSCWPINCLFCQIGLYKLYF